MARSNSFNKKEIEKNKQQKRKEKQQRREERKNNPTKSFEDMIAYVDENGMITDTPPDLQNKEIINAEDIVINVPKKTEEEKNPVIKGRVEYFNTDKGFGFIRPIGSIDKYFFHVSSTSDTLIEGNIVTFELERGQKGINAVKIALADKNGK
ncbi:MAG: cold shock domain-containing protein [Parabacteroides sp.]|jgi:Cold shock proteins|nr:cold shock domain-containing protein [Parabacteroides sp.]